MALAQLFVGGSVGYVECRVKVEDLVDRAIRPIGVEPYQDQTREDEGSQETIGSSPIQAKRYDHTGIGRQGESAANPQDRNSDESLAMLEKLREWKSDRLHAPDVLQAPGRTSMVQCNSVCM